MSKVKVECSVKWRARLLEKAKTLPPKTGCYLMKDEAEKILYIGKAKNLKTRVSSYFQKIAQSPKTKHLVSHIREVDFILTETEAEAFILENNLIKKHTPKYNIFLKDDKSYPYVVVNAKEPYPRLEYRRRVVQREQKEVFGPFAHGSQVSEVLRILTKSFQLRDCTLREFNSRKEPCLLFQMKQCSAPCVGKIDEKTYLRDLQMAVDFFKGKGEKSLKFLEEKMAQASHRQEFESALILRDSLEVLRSFLKSSQQKNVEFHGGHKNMDIFAYHESDLEVDISLYGVRGGILLGYKNFHFPVAHMREDVERECARFLLQYYLQSRDSFPDVVIVPFQKQVLSLLKEALAEVGKIKVRSPGQKYSSLIKLTRNHACESQRVRFKNQESLFIALNQLKDLLGLKKCPRLIECYDVAVFQGSSPTAAQVVFCNGRPQRKQYRHYRLESRDEGNNDFAMLREALTRRLSHAHLPDLFVVDGGRAQLNIFKKVLKDLEVDLPVVGIAKAKSLGSGKGKSGERLFIDGRKNPYPLNKNLPLLRMLTQMRDEAHRFSRKLHHRLEHKRVFHSWLDEIEGIGPRTKAKVGERLYQTPQELCALEVGPLSETLGVSLKVAQRILDHLNKTLR